PGFGPAVGVAERALDEGFDATVVFHGENPPHGDRLDALAERGATIDVVTALDTAADHLDGVATENVFVFGFDDFIQDVRELLEDAGHVATDAAIESFGPA
ncbi:oxidoreductase, partial [Halobacterium sp. KA-4]|nr:oxidoreductase [Halobacterium sp. KA-4]